MEIRYACSLGRCHSSQILKSNNLKKCSYPFDWIFSNSDIILHCLEDNFNLPVALSVVWDLIKSDIQVDDKLGTLLDFDRVLGLGLEDALNQPKEQEIPIEAKILIDERNIARLKKDFKKADEIRDRLAREFGITIRDR